MEQLTEILSDPKVKASPVILKRIRENPDVQFGVDKDVTLQLTADR